MTIELPAVPEATGIARIFHRTYPTAKLPSALEDNVANTKKLHPQWEHRLYDDVAIEQFIGEKYGQQLLDLYSSISPSTGAARADLFRYLVVYWFGGVYLDIKSTTTRPLDSLIAPNDEMLLSHWDNRKGESHEGWGIHPELGDRQPGELQQWHVIAVAGHPYLRSVIEAVVARIRRYSALRDGIGRAAVRRITGPIAYTLAIEPVMHSGRHRLVSASRDLGLNYSFYSTGFEHVQHFTTHYSLSTEPMVRPRDRMQAATFPIMRALHPCYDMARRGLSRLRRMFVR